MERKIFFGIMCNIFFELWVGNIFCGVMVNICVVGIVHFFFGGVSKNVWGYDKIFLGGRNSFIFHGWSPVTTA